MPTTERADGAPPPRPRARHLVTVTVLAVVGMVVAAGVFGWQGHDSPSTSPAATGSVKAETATVRRTDLSDTRTLSGTLGHGPARTVKGAGDGTVTWLPATGTTVTRGRQLYRVDDRPVPLFYGVTPLFRPLEARGTVGRDVRVIADNLRALGYLIGPQPSPGTWVAQQPVARTDPAPPGGPGEPGKPGKPTSTTGTETAAPSPSAPAPSAPAAVQVREGDGVLTSSLIAAVRRWQEHAGIPVTGVLEPGDAVVLPGAVRVGSVAAQRGDPAAEELLSVTSTAKKVTVELEAADIGAIREGNAVTVTLPDNSSVRGTVTAVGAVVQGGTEDGTGEGPHTTVTVSIRDSPAARRLDSAPVQVAFTSETRKDVLVVPVGALLALSEGGYAVQTPGGRLVAVRTGMFAKGLVEISGDGVRAGTKVVTTA